MSTKMASQVAYLPIFTISESVCVYPTVARHISDSIFVQCVQVSFHFSDTAIVITLY